MARRPRTSAGAFRYRARTATSAFKKKRPTSSTSKAGKRQARAAAYRAGKLPKPGTAAAARLEDRFLPKSEEVAFLKRANVHEQLSGGSGEYRRELQQMARAAYRKAYSAQQRGRPAKPKKKPTRIRVKAHWRRAPAGKR